MNRVKKIAMYSLAQGNPVKYTTWLIFVSLNLRLSLKFVITSSDFIDYTYILVCDRDK